MFLPVNATPCGVRFNIILNAYMRNFWCIEMGLLDNDQQWDTTMIDAEAVHSPSRIRNVFSIIICNVVSK